MRELSVLESQKKGVIRSRLTKTLYYLYYFHVEYTTLYWSS